MEECGGSNLQVLLRHTSARRSSSSTDQEIRLANAMKDFSRTILRVAEELDFENLTAANYSTRQCERTPLILPPDGGARHRWPAISRLLQYSSEWKEVFVRAAEEGKRWQEGKGAVIKLCKYSCGRYIINEALIRFDADQTQRQRLDLPARLLRLQTIPHFREPSPANTDPRMSSR